MRLLRVAEVSAALGDEPGRTAKVGLLAACLRAAGPDDVALVAGYLAGQPAERRSGLGPGALRDLPAAAPTATLTVREVHDALAAAGALSGPGAPEQRRRLLHGLLASATLPEQRLLAGLVTGDLRQGARSALVVEAVARAADLPLPEVRRAVMLGGLAEVAAAALVGGRAALARFRLEVGHPVQPMLAQSAPDVATALHRVGPAVVEWKLDGVRVQVHRTGPRVAVFTRTLEEVTPQVPEVVEAALSLHSATAILDGEVLALDAAGRPRPFQVTAARVSARRDVAAARGRTPLTLVVFDALHLTGVDLIDAPLAERRDALARAAPDQMRVPGVVTDDPGTAAGFAADTLARGHEGVVVKAMAAPYEAGRRGGAWLKVKPRHTLDLVVLAADWGHGRRSGWLSNLHLGARDPTSGGFVMLGKTFKGLTDAMLRWQTDQLLTLAVDRDRWTVRVRPELVVEVAFDGVQSSPRYPGGVALRFARVLRHRPDKPAAEADTIDAVVASGSAGPPR